MQTRRNVFGDAPLASLQTSMNRLLDDFTGGFGNVAPWGGAEFAPALDVAETPDSVRVRCEIPGIDPGEVDVSVTGNTLTIRGEKKTEDEQKGENYHRIERRYGQFVRTVELPSAIDAGKVEATCRNGVLTITLPKHEAARPRSIDVKVEG